MPATLLFVFFIGLLTLPIWFGGLIIALIPKLTKHVIEVRKFPVFFSTIILGYIVFPIVKSNNEFSVLAYVLISIAAIVFFGFSFRRTQISERPIKEFEDKNEIIAKRARFLKRASVAFLIFLVLNAIVIYLNPVDELMTCNKDYVCTVNQKFAFGLKKQKNYQLSKNSKMRYIHLEESSVSSIRFDRGILHYNPAMSSYKYTDKNGKLFKPFICRDSIRDHYEWWLKNDEQMLEEFNAHKKSFDEYISNPQKGYMITSSADGKKTIDILFILFIVFISYFILWNSTIKEIESKSNIQK